MNGTELNTDTLRQRIRGEALRLRESRLGRKLDQATLQQAQIEELNVRLLESEADRAARLEQIIELTRLLKESAARLDLIQSITGGQAAAGESFAIRMARYAVRMVRYAIRMARYVGLVKTRRVE